MAKLKSDSQIAALLRKAVELHQQSQLPAAQAAYLKYLKHMPRDGDTMGLLAVLKFQQGHRDGALDLMRRALTLAPDASGLRFNYAKMLVELRRFDEAQRVLEDVLAASPTFDAALGTLGTVLFETGRPAEAAQAFRDALALAPGNAHYAFNLAMAFTRLYQFEDAELALRQALTLDPTNIEARFALAKRLYDNKRFAEATSHYQAVLAHDRDDVNALGGLLLAKLRLAEWTDLDALSARFLNGVSAADGSSLAKSPSPYVATLISDDPAAVYKAAHARAAAKARHADVPREGRLPRRPTDKIRVAYVSGDYRAHATSYLICELIEIHDRSRFEIIGISYGPDDGSPMRARIAAAFDRFIDVAHCTPAQMAETMRELELDIAVDLQGFNQHNRMDAFAARPAPIQVLYLGWPGTSGASFYDYILTDPIVAPRENFPHFSEAVVWLPGSYQANDRQREVASTAPSRTECGLPENCFVFACFNNVFKILPSVFDVWIAILKDVPRSVLWLVEPGAEAEKNLRQRARAQDLDPTRLVFAPTLPNAQHLARLRHAHLMLDTLPYNAHTTASDALWQGIPIVTCTGRSFAGRVATSLLHSCGLSELAVDNLADYRRLAVKLATDPALLGATRAKLASARLTATLFNTPMLARGIEKAFVEMKRRYDDRKSPAPLDLSSE